MTEPKDRSTLWVLGTLVLIALLCVFLVQLTMKDPNEDRANEPMDGPPEAATSLPTRLPRNLLVVHEVGGRRIIAERDPEHPEATAMPWTSVELAPPTRSATADRADAPSWDGDEVPVLWTKGREVVPASDGSPHWRPRHQGLSFIRMRAGAPQLLYQAGPDAEPLVLASYDAGDSAPYHLEHSWSPDGSNLAYEVEYAPNSREVFRISFDYDTPSVPIALIPSRYSVWNFRWLSDGQRLSFTRKFKEDVERGTEIFTMSTSGADWDAITENRFWDQAASPSPVDDRIAFISLGRRPRPPAGESGHAAYIVDPSTGSEDLVVQSANHSVGPLWSPDGRHVLVSRDLSPWDEVALVDTASGTGDSDGLDRHPIQEPDMNVHYAIWSPDGSRIAYMRSPNGDCEAEPCELVVIRLDELLEGVPSRLPSPRAPMRTKHVIPSVYGWPSW